MQVVETEHISTSTSFKTYLPCGIGQSGEERYEYMQEVPHSGLRRRSFHFDFLLLSLVIIS